MKQVYGNAVKKFFPGMSRTCSRGHGVYLVTETMSRNGSYKCPKCASLQSVEYAKRNRAKKRAWNNAHFKRISSKRAVATAAYRERHPKARLAHLAVQTAIRNGSMKRQPCSVCGANNAHAHHEDYDKPLEVMWLCHSHHMERHDWLAERAK